MEKREFTGVWIPKEVLDDKDLTSDEKMLFADISSFSECFMSNAFMANRYGCSEDSIKRRIKKLKDKGYVVQSGFDGRKRYLQAVHIYTLRQCKSAPPEGANMPPIDNNIDNNIPSAEATASEEIKEVKDDQEKLDVRKSVEIVVGIFKEVTGRYSSHWRIRTNQRIAAANLLADNSESAIRKALTFYMENKDLEFCPQINSPLDLEEKWYDLIDFRDKQ